MEITMNQDANRAAALFSGNSLGAHLSSELVDYSKSTRPPLLRLSERSLEYGTMSTDKKDRTAGNLTNISSYASNII